MQPGKPSHDDVLAQVVLGAAVGLSLVMLLTFVASYARACVGFETAPTIRGMMRGSTPPKGIRE